MDPGQRGIPAGADLTALIWLNQSSRLHFQDNTVTNRGPFGKNLIEINEAVEQD